MLYEVITPLITVGNLASVIVERFGKFLPCPALVVHRKVGPVVDLLHDRVRDKLLTGDLLAARREYHAEASEIAQR